MDTARRALAILMVTMVPPALVWWFVIHPFVSFWRRLGPRKTLWIMGTAAIACAAGLWAIRDRLLGSDLGGRLDLAVTGGVLLAVGVWIALLRRRHLTSRILSGVPELEPGGSGQLLTEGIYARMRHPRYVEVAVGMLGYACLANHVGAWVVALATAPILHLIVLLEERELADRFGDEYEAYRARVPRYLPRPIR